MSLAAHLPGEVPYREQVFFWPFTSRLPDSSGLHLSGPSSRTLSIWSARVNPGRRRARAVPWSSRGTASVSTGSCAETTVVAGMDVLRRSCRPERSSRVNAGHARRSLADHLQHAHAVLMVKALERRSSGNGLLRTPTPRRAPSSITLRMCAVLGLAQPVVDAFSGLSVAVRISAPWLVLCHRRHLCWLGLAGLRRLRHHLVRHRRRLCRNGLSSIGSAFS